MGLNIDYVYEADPLGTAGALGLLPKAIPNKSIIMINGDILTNVDYNKLLDFHESSSSSATVAVRNYEHQVPFGLTASPLLCHGQYTKAGDTINPCRLR